MKWWAGYRNHAVLDVLETRNSAGRAELPRELVDGLAPLGIVQLGEMPISALINREFDLKKRLLDGRPPGEDRGPSPPVGASPPRS